MVALETCWILVSWLAADTHEDVLVRSSVPLGVEGDLAWNLLFWVRLCCSDYAAARGMTLLA